MQDLVTGFVVGALGWTLLEYIIHYPLGHLPKGKTLISSEHLKHHKDVLYFTPTLMKIRGAVPLLLLLGVAAYFLVNLFAAIGFVTAVAIGWTTYEVLHQSIHVRGPRTRYGRWATRHHLYHHFARPNRNHGVTTPIWDFVFRTYDPVERVAIREQDIERVPWLADALRIPEDAPAFVHDYEVRTRAGQGRTGQTG